MLQVNKQGVGSGHKREWPPSERAVVREIKRLLVVGFTLPAAAAGARALVENGWQQ